MINDLAKNIFSLAITILCIKYINNVTLLSQVTTCKHYTLWDREKIDIQIYLTYEI